MKLHTDLSLKISKVIYSSRVEFKKKEARLSLFQQFKVLIDAQLMK